MLELNEEGQENSTVVQGLLDDLVERGIQPEVKRLFVIDGSKGRCGKRFITSSAIIR